MVVAACSNRINYAIQNHRISPNHLDYIPAIPQQTMLYVKEAMEDIDGLAHYESPQRIIQFIKSFLDSTALSIVKIRNRESLNMNIQLILKYLSELSENNNREWYHLHKEEYEEANTQVEVLLQELILEIGKTNSSILHNVPKDITFKIVRDTRFSHDKSPYNPAFRAHISSMGKLLIPVGYYMMIKPGNQSFFGGGAFADIFKNATIMVCDYIVENSDE